jgi:hypothetical protein
MRTLTLDEVKKAAEEGRAVRFVRKPYDRNDARQIIVGVPVIEDDRVLIDGAEFVMDPRKWVGDHEMYCDDGLEAEEYITAVPAPVERDPRLAGFSIRELRYEIAARLRDE